MLDDQVFESCLKKATDAQGLDILATTFLPTSKAISDTHQDIAASAVMEACAVKYTAVERFHYLVKLA
jgi:hypothetical protein